MALAKKYISLNGQLVGEINKVEGTRTDYLTDALGSVVGTFTQEESAPNHINVLNTYRYKPNGTLLAKTGASPDPRYLWTGNSGSRYSARRFAEQYNWHRHYGQFQGQWTSRDILWPEESAFGYVNGRVLTSIDPLGLEIVFPAGCDTKFGACSARGSFEQTCKRIRTLHWTSIAALMQCVKKNPGTPANYIELLFKACNSKDDRHCVFCRNMYGKFAGLPDACSWMVDDYCLTIRPGWFEYGYACPPVDMQVPKERDCISAVNKMNCKSAIVICELGTGTVSPGGTDDCCRYVPIHELTHAITGGAHGRPGMPPPNQDWITNVSRCVCKVLYGRDKCNC